MSKNTLEQRAQQLYALVTLHPFADELLCLMEEQLADELTECTVEAAYPL